MHFLASTASRLSCWHFTRVGASINLHYEELVASHARGIDKSRAQCVTRLGFEEEQDVSGAPTGYVSGAHPSDLSIRALFAYRSFIDYSTFETSKNKSLIYKDAAIRKRCAIWRTLGKSPTREIVISTASPFFPAPIRGTDRV